LKSGTKLGPYEVISALGAGGMGEVYRARDTKLGREVALKVLPEAFASDAERMARFEREAKLLASLNHPNIAAIYGFEDSRATGVPACALIMELVEGQTLAEMISGAGEAKDARARVPAPPKALSLDEALPIARQISEGLEYAHDRGIVHRDLKPANVKVTPDGAVKILDFGLAKALEGDAAAQDPSSSPTMSRLATQAGIILGTASYMSPEQAKGKTVDRRADIWAFGCVLYEMLSGRKPFEGETVTDILAAVVRAEPDWSPMPPATPGAVRRLLERCLQKDPKQRLRDIGEARIVLEQVASGTTPDLPEFLAPAAAPARAPMWRRVTPWVIAALAVLAAISSTVALLTRPGPPSFPVLSYIPPPPGTTFDDFGFSAGPVTVSPGGKQLAFSATDAAGATKLWVRSLASDKAQAIPGTEDAAAPFWSPDGGSLGFFADEKLKTVNLSSGSVQILANASCNLGGAWSTDGTILFQPGCGGPLYKISSSGGKSSPAAAIEQGATAQVSPAFLPDGKQFLYESGCPHGGACTPSIWMGSLSSSGQKLILKDAASPQFSDGHLLFLQNSHVLAQSFDPATGKLSGQATVLAEAQVFSVSGGVLAFQGGTRKGRLEWYDRNGNPLGTVGTVAIYDSVRISPDGKTILAEIQNPQSDASDLWSFPAAGGVGTRLTFGPGLKEFATWSPDGKYIAYTCKPDGKPAVCRKPSNGSGAEEKLFTFGPDVEKDSGFVVGWSPDGRYLSLNEFNTRVSATEVWVFPLLGDRKPFQPAPVNSSEYAGDFSPDGRWLAYFSYESGRPEVYVVPFPGPGGKFQISQNGGWNCMWGKNGDLYFMSIGDRLVEAKLETSGGSVQVKAIQPLFQMNVPSFKDPFFDVSADGNRFIVVTSTDPNSTRSIGLLLDWPAKLKSAR
jgi:serine/threonine protein kinase/Tol biopolymer transport system component